MKAVRVLVADPTDGGAERISKLLSTNPRIEVVATARSGAECIRKAALARPHVVTMDLQFMDMSAAQIITALSAMDAPVSVYLIGPHVTSENPLLKEALDRGAFDFLRCHRTEDDLKKYERQIINTIFVAGLSSSKQIPQKDGLKRAAAGLDGLLSGKRLLAIGWAGDRSPELTGFLSGLRIGASADVLLILGAPPERGSQVLADVSEVVGFQVKGVLRGAEIAGGRLYLTVRRKQDVIVAEGPTGRDCFQYQERRGEDESGPNLDVLFKSMASYYKEKAAAMLVGGDGTDGIYGMKAIQDAGGATLVDDRSTLFLSSLRKWLPNARIPQAVTSLDDLHVLLRELA
jgi:two-component system chemotaxis response regulator CheB